MLKEIYLSRYKRKIVAINITPLVDVIFQLLIFFMVSSTFLEQPAIKLELPKSKTAEASQVKDVTITLSKEGKVFLNDILIDKEGLKASLKKVAAQDNQRSVVFKADQNSAYGQVIDIIDIIRASGLKKILALTRTDEQSE